ncbi:MAG TPA: hypothetical protein VN894_07235, partial [Polyangiaceae bacterium]|nr:hypothetical protein [Polyangiaceae bacterium]
MKRATATVALAVAVAAGCTGAAPARLPAPPLQPPLFYRGGGAPPHVSNVPVRTYWEPVDAPVVAAALDPAELPVPLAQLTRSAGAEARWQAAPPALRDGIASRGFV